MKTTVHLAAILVRYASSMRSRSALTSRVILRAIILIVVVNPALVFAQGTATVDLGAGGYLNYSSCTSSEQMKVSSTSGKSILGGVVYSFAHVERLGPGRIVVNTTIGVTAEVFPFGTCPIVNFDFVHFDHSSVPLCTDAYWEGVLGASFEASGVNQSKVTKHVEFRVKTNLFKWNLPNKNGRYALFADGRSQASASSPDQSASSLTWTFVDSSLGCSLANGVLTASKTVGTVTVKAETSGGILCFQGEVDLVPPPGPGDPPPNPPDQPPPPPPCESCGSGDCGSGAPSFREGSVDVRLNLGWSLQGGDAGYLLIKEDFPSPSLASPDKLQYYFIRADVERITNSTSGLLRQIRSPQFLANIVTNTVFDYRIDLYSSTNIGTFNTTSNIYDLVSGANAIQTMTITNVNSDTNKLRIIQTREGTSSTWDYSWITNGWELVSGGGIRKEVKTVAWSETNTLRTVTYQIKDGGNSLIFQQIQKFRTNATMGDRLIEEIAGTGPNALTNSYSYTSAGLLQQIVRADGSWSYYVYDSQNRPTNVFSSYRNQAVTTDKSLCRFVEYDYSTTYVDASADNGFKETTRPRRTIEKLLNQEVGRKYFMALHGEWREYQCITPGAAWNDANNLVTSTKFFTEGFYTDQIKSVKRPDGTITVNEFGPVVVYETNLYRTNIVYSGHPNDSNGTNIDRGTKTVSIIGSWGQLLSQTVYYVPSLGSATIAISSETYTYDGFQRLTNTVYLDNTSSSIAYQDCCNASTSIDREGVLRTNSLDALQRILTSMRDGITVSNVYDAAGSILSSIRIGTNGNAITTSSATFDDAGRQMSSTDALNNTTGYTNYISGGQTVRQTTYPNSSTRIETYNRDGSMASVTGTAVHGVRYDYGVESESGTQRAYAKEIKLDTGGSDTSEWVKTYADMLGRSYKVVYPDSAASQNYFNSIGQTSKQTDPDGVTTLFQYNELGELAYTAIDLNTNGTIEFSSDRLTQTTNFVTTANGKDVRRTLTYIWATDGSSTATLATTTDASVDGLRTWTTNFGLVSQSQTLYAGSGTRYVINTAPDGTLTTQTFQNGRITRVETTNSGVGTINLTTYGYDPHGRQSLITDARTGTATNSFDNADRVITVSTPAPGDGSSAQVTAMIYNKMGWVVTNTLPDGGIVTTIYHLTGEVATNSGARTYPVAYTYDYAGRLKTMKTWKDFAGNSGAATTTWNYDANRGFLSSKVYDDSKGTTNTYTAAGRLKTRAWARGVTTTYSYNSAGDLTNSVYSDSTPAVVTAYDRRGRASQTTVGTSSTSSLVYSDAGNLLSESFTAGPLSGILLTNQYNSLLLRTSVSLLKGSTLLASFTNTYDVASRLSSVTFGTNSATYGYLTNSALVDTLTFKNGGSTRMTTSNRFDSLNRLTLKDNRAGSTPISSFAYAYNSANQRTAITNTDSSRWAYGYDSLGQVTSGKRSWSDGFLVAGQQFEYSFDDIGNRKTSASGGDVGGNFLRIRNYTANNLNQYSSGTVPGYAEMQGAATNTGTVTVSLQPTYRKGEYYRAELNFDNSVNPVWLSITNIAVLQNGTNADIVTTNIGNLLLAKSTEGPTYDLDGNLTSDSLWTNTWNGENRLIATETASGVPSSGKAKETWSYLGDGRWLERVIYSWTGSNYVAQTTNRFVWDGQVLLAVVDHTNGLVSSFVRGLDLSGSLQGAGGVGGVLAVNIASNGVHFTAFDGNGNVSALVSATSGAVTANYEYSPSGETLRANGVVAKANPIRFSTQLADDVTGDLKYLFREERPSTGRWLSRDPIEEQGGWALYAFVANSAANFVDSFGLYLTPDHTKLTTIAIDQALQGHGVSRCVRNQIVERINGENRRQDSKHAKDLERHYNRPVKRNESVADKLDWDERYRKYIYTELREFEAQGNKKTKEGCDAALGALGRLSHSWEDFFAHAIPRNASGADFIAWTRGITGDPDNRGQFYPSSYSLGPPYGEHPPFGEPIPPLRGAEGAARFSAAQTYMNEVFSGHLSHWLTRCNCLYSCE